MAEKKKDPARVQLKNVRLSFASIYRPKGFGGGRGDDNGEPKYSANFLIDPETREGKVNIDRMEDAIEHVLKTTDWGGKTPKFSDAKLPLREGDDHDYDGYDGMMYVSASNGKKPRILDIDKLDVSEGDDGAPYSGCYVDAIVRVWGQNNKFGKRINASLEGVRFRDDGDPFGAAPLDPDEFDDDDDDDRGSRRRRGRTIEHDPDEKPRRSRRSRDDEQDEEEEAPRRRRSRGEDEEEEAPRRRRSRDEDEEEDEKPRRRRSRDDDKDEEKPRSRRSRDEDDEEDEAPRRRRSRDDDEREERRGRRSRDDEDEKPRRRRSRDDDLA